MQQIIAETDRPRTRASLAADLAALGVAPGQLVMLHVSLRALGFVVGGAMTLLDAVLDRLGPDGTLMMPAHSADLSDPGQWAAPPVPAGWVEEIRAAMPAYDPARTPTWGLGAVAELFRTWPGVMRSNHPAASVAARGPLAAEIVGRHPLDDPHGEASPLARAYDRDVKLLLLGVGWNRATLLHLAERRAWPDAAPVSAGAPITRDGRRVWQTYRDYDSDPERFAAVGEALAGDVVRGKVGSAAAILVDGRTAVDTAVRVLARS
ncbi:AAC(3) family N-acetyltransferase [Aliidongia dinghuensis]|uniref:Aminoglycoside N(3)-acetyltransferase n=1 Tax=Aliidongia dinghuensis TaxID=1867774 RepID=A0A8J3E1P5_9PROT|nr:AAC(3) family N-acetyltransferase [Aliidongia dinghuensis]GGF13980.1 AAC(3) family N-acetyltransferase [Aliidongia dinghuensis]